MTRFVNIHGQPVHVSTTQAPRPRAVRDQPPEFHKGWRVVGHPPLAAAEARAKRKAEIAAWEKDGRIGAAPKPFDEGVWRSTTRLKPVRSKPYEIEEAAQQCAQMAAAGGWTEVQIVAIKKSLKASDS